MAHERTHPRFSHEHERCDWSADVHAVSADGRVSGGWQLAGSPVRVVSQMPDCVPGSTLLLFANLEQLYLVITRRGVGMMVDPYSGGGWCIIHRFDARIGGNVVCPAAGGLFRIQCRPDLWTQST